MEPTACVQHGGGRGVGLQPAGAHRIARCVAWHDAGFYEDGADTASSPQPAGHGLLRAERAVGGMSWVGVAWREARLERPRPRPAEVEGAGRPGVALPGHHHHHHTAAVQAVLVRIVRVWCTQSLIGWSLSGWWLACLACALVCVCMRKQPHTAEHAQHA